MTKQGKRNQNKKGSPLDLFEILKENNPLIPREKTEKKEEAGNENYRRYFFAEKIGRKEEQLYNSREKQVERQTQILLGEIQKELEELKKANLVLDKEIEKAVNNSPAELNVYHLSFFEHLRAIIKNLRKTIEDSSLWLAAWNGRQEKRGFFWSTFLNKKKGGSQFLLSGEHFVSRSAG